MMHPVGPHAPQTYWLRRTLVAVIAVAVVAGGVWWALGRGTGSGPDKAGAVAAGTTPAPLTGVLATAPIDESSTGPNGLAFDDPSSDGDASGTAAPHPTGVTGDGSVGTATGVTGPTTTATTTPATSPTETARTSPVSGVAAVIETTVPAPVTVTVTKQAVATGTSAKPAARTTTAPPKPSYDSAGRLICPASSISLTGVVWGTIAGQQPRLGMNVTNIGSQTCQQDVSGADQVYTVYTAAGARVWSTADCFPGEGHDIVSLSAGQKVSFVIVWGGMTSAPGCSAPRVVVKAGNYKLVVQLGALKSKPLPFTMR